mmetsp:Transcript_105682/g.297250  ORF Transcript_105682/g.297250 Transcript_105682/m.297250 type:complete len:298 (+) Transcript_105682:1903-2796(+)
MQGRLLDPSDWKRAIKPVRVKRVARHRNAALGLRTHHPLVVDCELNRLARVPVVQIVGFVPLRIQTVLYGACLAHRRRLPPVGVLHLAFHPGCVASEIEVLQMGGLYDRHSQALWRHRLVLHDALHWWLRQLAILPRREDPTAQLLREHFAGQVRGTTLQRLPRGQDVLDGQKSCVHDKGKASQGVEEQPRFGERRVRRLPRGRTPGLAVDARDHARRGDGDGLHLDGDFGADAKLHQPLHRDCLLRMGQSILSLLFRLVWGPPRQEAETRERRHLGARARRNAVFSGARGWNDAAA